MTRATVDGLRRLVRPEDVAELRGKRIVDVLPFPRAGRQAEEAADEAPDEAPAAEVIGEAQTVEETAEETVEETA
jgi:hypothetical protein